MLEIFSTHCKLYSRFLTILRERTLVFAVQGQGIWTDFNKNWLAQILIGKKSDCLLLSVVVIIFYPPFFNSTCYAGPLEGLKIWRGATSNVVVIICPLGLTDLPESGKGDCVFKWILRGHLKSPQSATIWIMFEVMSIKFLQL